MKPEQLQNAAKFLAGIKDPTDPKVDAKKLAELSAKLQAAHSGLKAAAQSVGSLARFSVELNVPCQRAVMERKLAGERKAAEG